MTQDAQLYNVILDETTDISNESQLSPVLKNIHKYAERELEFVESCVRDSTYELVLTGIAIGENILTMMKNNGLDTKCVGVGTDGCTVTVSELR